MKKMNLLKIVGIVVIVAIVLTVGADIGQWLSIPGSERLISPAEARVGRPLTPVSVAGVGRRTVRRCATGVYNCKLDVPIQTAGLDS